MSSANITYESDVVTSRLEGLHLQEVIIRDAIYQAYLHRVRLTPNHPPSFPGLEMWGWAVASLREQLRPLDWVAVNIGNYALTVHEDISVAINVASGDENTGNTDRDPTTRSKKGSNTVDAVETNYQADMFSELLPLSATQSVSVEKNHDTWLVLHFIDAVKKEIRIEISRPTRMDNEGKVSEWTDRIILTPISFDGEPIEVAQPAGPDLDIEIRRKS